MITIEFMGESKSGGGCNCSGKNSTITVKRKEIYGKVWEVGKPQEVSIDEFDKYMMTGLFLKKQEVL